MGKRLLQQRKGKASSILNNSVRTHKIAPSKYPASSYAQRNGYCVLTVRRIAHESGRAAPLASLTAHSQIHRSRRRAHFVAVEGIYAGKSIAIGTKAKLSVGNILPLAKIPEGCAISNVELRPSDGGKMCRSAGTFSTVISHNQDNNTVLLKLPSGEKKRISGNCLASIGQIAASGVTEPPILKAGLAFFRRKAKGKKSVRVCGMAMNPVDHPHGGGNHQHIGAPTCVSKHLGPGKKAQGHVAARMTGRKKHKAIKRS
ncbi:MAG: hypothetical protein MHMPM18_000061 [Marteilia pararefringens]